MRIHFAASLAACVLLAAPLAARTTRDPVTHEVRMISTGTAAHFEPAEVVAHPGDRIRFVNAQGGPHNVSFDPAHLPDDVRRALSAAMADQIQPLWGPLLTTPNQEYTITLNGVKPGRYEFFCMPHQALGMKGVLIVR